MDVEVSTDKLYYRVARGRYLWDPTTEDFTLFVTSLHHAMKELLEQTEEGVAKKRVQVLRKTHPYKVKVDIDLYFRMDKEITGYKG